MTAQCGHIDISQEDCICCDECYQGLIQIINLDVGRYRGQTRRRHVCPREAPKAI